MPVENLMRLVAGAPAFTTWEGPERSCWPCLSPSARKNVDTLLLSFSSAQVVERLRQTFESRAEGPNLMVPASS